MIIFARLLGALVVASAIVWAGHHHLKNEHEPPPPTAYCAIDALAFALAAIIYAITGAHWQGVVIGGGMAVAVWGTTALFYARERRRAARDEAVWRMAVADIEKERAVGDHEGY